MNLLIWIIAGAVLGLVTYASAPEARPHMAYRTVGLSLAGAILAGCLVSLFAHGLPPLFHGVVACLGAAAALGAAALTSARLARQ